MVKYAIITLVITAGVCVFFFFDVGSRIIAIIASPEERAVLFLKACFHDVETIGPCAKEKVETLLQQQSGGDVMALLSRSLTTGQCHTIGHVVGQQVYARYQNLEKAIDMCGHLCTSSCVHGATGQAFIEEAGLTADVDVQHLSAEDVRQYGKQLCTSVGTCHGIGHILFQSYNDFADPVAVCGDVADGEEEQSCFTGVFMEMFDPVSSHNLLLGTKKKQIRDPDNLKAPCDAVGPNVRHACLRYLFRIHDAIFTKENVSEEEIGVKRIAFCESFERIKDRSDCFEGMGFDAYRLVGKSVPEARRFCERLSLATDRAGCMVGMIFWSTAYGQVDEALSYCVGVSGEYEQNVCYHAMFDMLRTGATLPETHTLCEQGGESCSRAYEEYKKDPWKTLFGLKI